MSNDDVYLKLYDWIVSIGRDKATILPEDSFKNDLGFDSLDIAETIMWAEEEFDINIAEADMQDIKTVAEFADHIELLRNY